MTKTQFKALIAYCVGLGFLLAAAPEVRGEEPEPMKVRVARAAEREVPVTTRLVGTVRPELRSVLGSEIAGLVSRTPLRVGLVCALDEDHCRLQFFRQH